MHSENNMVVLGVKLGIAWKSIKYSFAPISFCGLPRNMEYVWAGEQAELFFLLFLRRNWFLYRREEMAVQRENWHLLALVTGFPLCWEQLNQKGAYLRTV